MWFTVTAWKLLPFSWAAADPAPAAAVAARARLCTSCLRLILPASKSRNSWLTMCSTCRPPSDRPSMICFRPAGGVALRHAILNHDCRCTGVLRGFLRTGRPGDDDVARTQEGYGVRKDHRSGLQ